MQPEQENRTAGRNEQCEGVDRAQARSLEADGSRPVAARSVEELCAPEGLTPAEQLDYWRGLAQGLYALAKQYASECGECSGRGFTVGDDGVSGRGPDDVEPTRYACEDCADIREVIAKAEGRS